MAISRTAVFVGGGGSIRIDCAEWSSGDLQFEYHDVEPLRGGAVVLSVDAKTEYKGDDDLVSLSIATYSEEGQQIDAAYTRCQSEAKAAFGSGDMYVEQLVLRARHIEVQVSQ